MIVFPPPPPMPETGFAGVHFELERVDYAAHAAGGRIGGVTAGAPLWMLEADLANMRPEDADAWRAWRLRRRGQQRQFLGHEPGREYPRAHPRGFDGMSRPSGGAFDGSATGWSEEIDANGDVWLTLGGMPNWLTLGQGDYVGFRWDGADEPPGSHRRRAMVRVVDGAESASGAIRVMIEPAVPLVVPAGAIAHLDRPACLMRVQDSRLGRQRLGYTEAGGRITALQDLRP